MNNQQQVNNQNNQNQAQQQQQQYQPQAPRLPIGKMVLGYMILNFIMSTFAPAQDPKQNLGVIGNYVQDSELFDLEIAVMKGEEEIQSWKEYNITYDFSFDNFREHNFTLNYEQLYTQPYPIISISLSSQQRDLIIYNETEIIKIIEKKDQAELKNLLFDEYNEEDEIRKQEKQRIKKEEFRPKEFVPHHAPKFYIYFIKDINSYNKNAIPPPFNKLELIREGNATYYIPFIDSTNWWLRQKEMIPINDGEQDREYSIQVQFDTYWSFKFMIQHSLMNQNQMYKDMGIDADGLGMGEEAYDMIKEMLVENNPYYLAITFAVSILHSLFEFLAMKNDVMFWRNLESHKGISVRSLYTNFFMDIIIFMYLLDSEETSMMILVPSFIEIFITIWKIMKTTRLERRSYFPYVKILPRQNIYMETTDKYDKYAIKWMYIILLPCFIGYLIYSLYNDEHKGWYSYVLNSMVGFIYLFGFVNMTPQLYINYKLKSVDHLPWRTMIYKFLNTIVDDFFAFAISMPWLKRLSCFRDDLIFCIYIYQRWIYKVDPRRTQYGFVKDEVVLKKPENVDNNENKEQNNQQQKSAQEKKSQ